MKGGGTASCEEQANSHEDEQRDDADDEQTAMHCRDDDELSRRKDARAKSPARRKTSPASTSNKASASSPYAFVSFVR